MKNFALKRLLSRALLVASIILLFSAPALAQSDAVPAPVDEAATTELAPAAEPAPVVEVPKVAPVPAPVVALSPAPVPKTALDNLSSEVMNVLVPVFGTLISGLVTLLLLWLRRRFKLEISDQQISSWSFMARKGALRAAEWARKKAKELTEDKKIPGPEILEVGVNWALEAGKAAGLPEMGREKLEGWVEAELFDLRREENGGEVANPI